MTMAIDVLFADVSAQQGIWIIQKRLCDRTCCDKGAEILGNSGGVWSRGGLVRERDLVVWRQGLKWHDVDGIYRRLSIHSL